MYSKGIQDVFMAPYRIGGSSGSLTITAENRINELRMITIDIKINLEHLSRFSILLPPS